MDSVYCGIDIGARENATTILKGVKASVQKFDFFNDGNGNVVEFSDALIPNLVQEYITTNDTQFRNVNVFGIEKQMILKEKPKVPGLTKITFVLFECAMKAALQSKYPDSEVYVLRPQDVRKMMGTSVQCSGNNSKDYADRKQKSREMNLMTDADFARCCTMFTKNGRTKIDDIQDSIALSLYLRRNIERLRGKGDAKKIKMRTSAAKFVSTDITLSESALQEKKKETKRRRITCS